MCNRYISPDEYAIEEFWKLKPSGAWRGATVFPRAPGVFVRARSDGEQGRYERVIGQWGLIPLFAKEPKLPYSTNNARFEEITEKASYRALWARGQRCVIPAVSFDEPCWETGKNVWWRFKRTDGELWNLAGLWNAWVDRGSGEIFESYTMLTINADAHPLMRRMHKPDPKYGPDEQDKRSVIPIEKRDLETWLFGSLEEARKLAKLQPVKVFDAAPVANKA